MVSTAPRRTTPYDFDIDATPTRSGNACATRPLYYNEKYDFYAISRTRTWNAPRSNGRRTARQGSVLEIIKARWRCPGLFIFEDPPDHDLHRAS